ncbi:hypothetical protein [Pyxidicoccus fallax]|uniref:hypothetical protein n=1 Tax=Pyxidicoccus fallax TaxID=394095 RepID=UPI0031B60AAF
MDGYNDILGPRIVTIDLASALGDYILRTQELGAVEGARGALEINPALRPVLEALHHVLAGGEVEVRITRAGNPDLVEELGRRAARAIQEANLLHLTAGIYPTVTV